MEFIAAMFCGALIGACLMAIIWMAVVTSGSFDKEHKWKIYHRCPVCKHGMETMGMGAYDKEGKLKYICSKCGYTARHDFHFETTPGRIKDDGTFEWREWNE